DIDPARLGDRHRAADDDRGAERRGRHEPSPYSRSISHFCFLRGSDLAAGGATPPSPASSVSRHFRSGPSIPTANGACPTTRRRRSEELNRTSFLMSCLTLP